MKPNFLRRLAATFQASFEVSEIAALMFTIKQDQPGALQNVLQCFCQHNLNLTHIESRPASVSDRSEGFTFIVDFDTPDQNSLQSAMRRIQKICHEVTLVGGEEVPWFPRKLEDLNQMTQAIRELPSNHPGSSDQTYQARRIELQTLAISWKIGARFPHIDYSAEETEAWQALYAGLEPVLNRVACEDYLVNLAEMQESKVITPDAVPQLSAVNEHLLKKTGFRLKPVAALASQRDFLNCLAFRVFPTTVHMRYPGQPYFSMDPDIAHETLGHGPMLASPEFAEFVQEIGLASLGASDEDITKLMNLYFYSVEHGLVLTNLGERKVYGARLLSSVDEIYHALSIKPELRHFDAFQACKFKYSRKNLQPVYWFSSDFREAKSLVRRFNESLSKPFHAVYDRKSSTIRVDHKIKGIR